MIKLFKWLIILGVFSVIRKFDFVALTKDNIYTILFYLVFIIIVFIAQRFVNMSKRYLYNFNYFYIDKKINESDNLIPNMIFSIENYEDIPEPKKFYLPALSCLIVGLLLFGSAASIISISIPYIDTIELAIALVLIFWAMCFLIYLFFMNKQINYYKKYYNILEIGGVLIDEINEHDNK